MQTGPEWAGGAIPRLFVCAAQVSRRVAIVLMAVVVTGTVAMAAEQDAQPAAHVGRASWYGAAFHLRQTASGERFDQHRMTCAHRTLPLGTTVRVTNLLNGRSVLVTITDRGPFRRHRDIDVSYGAARVLGMVQRGVARVRIEPVSWHGSGAREAAVAAYQAPGAEVNRARGIVHHAPEDVSTDAVAGERG